MIKGKRIQEIRASRNILYTTIKIEDAEGTGTGFFYHIKVLSGPDGVTYIPLIVTNRHVIQKSKSIRLVFHLGPEQKFKAVGGVCEFIIEDPKTKFLNHPNPDIDLCAIKIEGFLQEIKAKTGKDVYYQALSTENLLMDVDTEDLFPIEDVYMIGYPRGLWDQANNLPIARKGITASDPRFDFNGQPKGLVDIATFEGSSGSPIILIKELGYTTFDDDRKSFFLLGVLEDVEPIDLVGEVFQFDEKRPNAAPKKVPGMYASTDVMMHLGKFLRSKVLIDLEPLFL